MLCRCLALIYVHPAMEIIKKSWAEEAVILRTCAFQLREINIKIDVFLFTCLSIILNILLI